MDHLCECYRYCLCHCSFSYSLHFVLHVRSCTNVCHWFHVDHAVFIQMLTVILMILNRKCWAQTCKVMKWSKSILENVHQVGNSNLKLYLKLVATFRSPTASFIGLVVTWYWARDQKTERTQLHEQRWRGVQLTDSIRPSFGHVINITWPQAWWSSPLANETSQLILGIISGCVIEYCFSNALHYLSKICSCLCSNEVLCDQGLLFPCNGVIFYRFIATFTSLLSGIRGFVTSDITQ